MTKDDETKLTILDMAIQLFSEKGYESVTVQEVCDYSKITKPTVYYYFHSKAGLLQAIADIKGQEFLNTITNAAEYVHDFPLSLTKILKAEMDFAQANKNFFRLHASLLNAPRASEAGTTYISLIEKLDKILLEFFQNSTNEIGNMKGKEKLYATLFQNNVTSVIINVLNGGLKLDDQTTYQIIHSFMYGVVA